MKSRKLGITFLSVAAFTVGCKPSDEKNATGQGTRNAAASPLEKVKSDTNEAAHDLQDYTYG